ncbi:MAG: DUF4304 domain-containing protein [Methylococcales bacterium]|nr:DUF4304 domain-containing protein [Methylococcales bacterium]
MTSLSNLVSSFFCKRREATDTSIPKLTRNQARKLVIESITPYLQSEGFLYQKKLLFWRISTSKTDVIELRFLLNREPDALNLPLSTFSILGGCYYNFVPNVFDEKIIHQIPDIVTPYETHCHLRFTVKPNLQQPIFKKNDYWWHVDGDDIETSEVLKDVQAVLKNQLLPLMNKFDNIKELLSLLESQTQMGFDIGIGKPDSFKRQYLLGFTYLKLEDKKLALQHLNKAKKLLDELLTKVKEPMSLHDDAPIIRQSNNIIQALEALKQGSLE